jgi:hypothetical protein
MAQADSVPSLVRGTITGAALNRSTKRSDRRYFIGGSDAEIIMGDDEGALLRLWREKRGEAEPKHLSRRKRTNPDPFRCGPSEASDRGGPYR